MNNQELKYTYSEIEEIILNNKSEDAIKLLISLLKNDKEDFEIAFEKAMIYYYIENDLLNALEQLDNCLYINPNYIDALLLKIEILAGLHWYTETIKIFNKIHPKILPYGYKKLIEYITEYNHRSTLFFNLYDFDSYWVYFYVESHYFKRITEVAFDLLEYEVLKNGLIWKNLDSDAFEYKNHVPVVSGSRLSEEEPYKESEINRENCIICGRKLKKNEKNLCKACLKKQYASRIIKKLVSIVKPEVQFKKEDLKSLNLDDIQIKDYIWTLQEFNLIEVDNNKFKLKDENTLNNFRINSKMDPIDFETLKEQNKLDKTCNVCGKTLPVSQFYKSSDGYEDTCKNCKKLMVSAKYLEDIINYVGFENEFDENDLNQYIANKSQIMGMIWSLQEKDLLIGKTDNKYVLAEKSQCLTFLEKYNPDYNIDEKNIKGTTKTKSESKSTGDLDGTDILAKFDSIKKGKKSKSYPESVNERKQMEFVLKLLRQGKSIGEAAKFTELEELTIVSWCNQGKENYSENTSYFYEEVQKIKDKEIENTHAKELRSQIKEFIPKFTELKNKIGHFNVKSNNLILIEEEINSNLDILNRANRFRRVDKLENILSNANSNYAELNKRLNNEIDLENEKINRIEELRVQIKEIMHKFDQLDNKIGEIDGGSEALYSIRKEIRSVIVVLNSEYYSNNIDVLKDNLSYARRSYFKLDKAMNKEAVNIEKKVKALKVEINELIHKFMEFDDKIEDSNLKSYKLHVFKKEIRRNINLLKYGYDSKNVYNLNNDLSNAQKSYDKLTKKLSDDLKRFEELKKYSDSLISREMKNSSSSILTSYLDIDEIKEINEKIHHEISTSKLKSEYEVYTRFNEFLEENSVEKSNKLLEEFYIIVGKTNFSGSFLEKLSENNLDVNSGKHICSVVEGKIKDFSIKNKNEINQEINKLFIEEKNRQERSLNKLDVLLNNNVYLMGLSDEDKEKIKDNVIKSIKENRLDYLNVYSEFKRVIEEFKNNMEIIDSNDIKNDDMYENNENNSSGGFLSKIKRLFGRE